MIRSFSVPCVSVLVATLIAASAAPSAAQNSNGTSGADAAKRAQIAQARAQMTEAQGRLRAAEARIRATYKAQPALLQAENELEAAQAALEAAKKPILAKLADDPAYKEEMKLKEEYEARIQAEHAKALAADPAATQAAELPSEADPKSGPTVTQKQESLNVPVPTDAGIVAAVDKANQRNKLRDMEQAAIANDPTASAAVAKVDAATQQLKALQLEFEATLLNDPEYKGALDQVNAARARMIEAGGANTGSDQGGRVIFR